MLKHIREQEFANEIVENEFVVVDFYADWCGPCQMLGPVFEELSEEFANVSFLKVNVDSAMELCKKFKITSIPLVLFFKKGELVDKVLGFSGKDNLKEVIKKHL